jgi:hypothetical protein
MVGTFTKIDYRLRPAKHAERTMLVDLFRKMRFAPIDSYQYVGFGSVAFVDFKMVHRALGIIDLVSIEDAQTPEERVRFRRNNPMRHIDLRFGNSSAVLPMLDFRKRSIVWLDYDGALTRSMANDMASIASTAASGTFVGVTLTTNFKHPKQRENDEFERLKAEFHEFVDPTTKVLTFQNPEKHAEFARNALGSLLQTALSNADGGKLDLLDHRTAYQVCYFRYSDGAPMITVGWLIVDGHDLATMADCKLSSLHFYRANDVPFKIKMPLVTPMEIREMERRLPNITSPAVLKWIPQKERAAFVEMHRYLPSFGNVEPI